MLSRVKLTVSYGNKHVASMDLKTNNIYIGEGGGGGIRPIPPRNILMLLLNYIKTPLIPVPIN